MLQKENDGLQAAFFKYCDTVRPSDLLTLAWQNFN